MRDRSWSSLSSALFAIVCVQPIVMAVAFANIAVWTRKLGMLYGVAVLLLAFVVHPIYMLNNT